MRSHGTCGEILCKISLTPYLRGEKNERHELLLQEFPHGRADHVIGRAARHFCHDDLHDLPHIGRRGRAGFSDGILHKDAQFFGRHGFGQEGLQHIDLGFVGFDQVRAVCFLRPPPATRGGS